MSQNKSQSFLIGAALGTLTGAVVALLYAPQAGEKTRAVLSRKKKEWREKTQELEAEIEKRGGALKIVSEVASNLIDNLDKSAQKLSREAEKEWGTPDSKLSSHPQALGQAKPSKFKKKPRFFKGV